MYKTPHWTPATRPDIHKGVSQSWLMGIDLTIRWQDYIVISKYRAKGKAAFQRSTHWMDCDVLKKALSTFDWQMDCDVLKKALSMIRWQEST